MPFGVSGTQDEGSLAIEQDDAGAEEDDTENSVPYFSKKKGKKILDLHADYRLILILDYYYWSKSAATKIGL